MKDSGNNVKEILTNDVSTSKKEETKEKLQPKGLISNVLWPSDENVYETFKK